MALRDELIDLLRQRDVIADDISTELAADLKRILKGLLDSIREAGTDQLTLEEIQGVRQLLRLGGYDDLLDKLEVETAHMLDVTQERYRKIGLPEAFVSPNPTMIEVLIDAQRADYEFYGDEIAHTIQQSLRRSILGGQTIDQSVEVIEAALDNAGLNPANAYTIANSSLLDFAQRSQNVAATEAGAEWYAFLGPDDNVTRPFCQALLDKRFTIEQIDQLDNGQIPDVFNSRGGWSCRHSWLPVFFEDQLEQFPIGDVAEANNAASERRSAA